MIQQLRVTDYSLHDKKEIPYDGHILRARYKVYTVCSESDKTCYFQLINILRKIFGF